MAAATSWPTSTAPKAWVLLQQPWLLKTQQLQLLGLQLQGLLLITHLQRAETPGPQGQPAGRPQNSPLIAQTAPAAVRL